MSNYTEKEIQELNESDFAHDRELAAECPARGYAPSMACDGCRLMPACTSLEDQ